jgi:hypothetical protein
MNNGALPLDPAYPKHLNVSPPTSLPYNCNPIEIQFATKRTIKIFNPYVLSSNPMLQII